MKSSIFIILLVACASHSKLLSESDNILELIKSSGYRGEAHQVETEDGYLLKVHRIVTNSTKQPVFLMHGILATSGDFLVTGPKIALGFLLADNGYDVWLGNARGNSHSSKHKKFSEDSNEFWDFSWHEIGFYDLSAMIDYMLNKTKASKFFYAGHSQGTTSFLVLLSTRPEYNEKIIKAHLMAPSAFRKKLPRLKTIMFGLEFLDSVENYRFLDLSMALHAQDTLSKILCRRDNKVRLQMCLKLISRFVGTGQKEVQIDTDILPNLTQYLSKRVSIKQLTHYYQNMITDSFRQFDRKSQNLKFYNSTTPPDYNLKLVVTPIHLYHASEDLYASIKGVEFLAKSLPNVRQLRTIDNWNHIDFVYGKNSRTVLYENILKSLNSSS